VHAYLLRPDPRQEPPDAIPQVVIPPAGDRLTAGVAEQLPVLRGVTLLAVLDQAGHQGGGDRLPAHRLTLLRQQDQALVRVQVGRAQGQRAAAAARGLGVQPQQQRVQVRVVARGSGDLVDLGQPDVGDGRMRLALAEAFAVMRAERERVDRPAFWPDRVDGGRIDEGRVVVLRVVVPLDADTLRLRRTGDLRDEDELACGPSPGWHGHRGFGPLPA
jgi:hypothetical protein